MMTTLKETGNKKDLQSLGKAKKLNKVSVEKLSQFKGGNKNNTPHFVH